MAEIAINRVFSTPGVSPFDQVTWVKHDVVLTDYRTGEVTFEQRGVEFPDFWDTTAVNIVTSKYFYGQLGDHNREASLRTLIERVAGAYYRGGIKHRYWAEDSENAEVFYDELCYLLLHQMFSFNSPVWFNVGTPGAQQVSACFILGVEDNIPSILNWFTEEGLIFKNGSGAGCNLSKIRGSREAVTGGGTASGPVSFMRGADSVAGMVKSGGKTRRAAKMVILDDDHPDILEFIRIKTSEEKKIRALRDAGFDMSVGGEDMASVQYQNANNSVMLSDRFMEAVEADHAWALRDRTTGETSDVLAARQVMREIATSAWECGDPGVMFRDTINRMNTLSDIGPIEASNPCLRADTMIPTRLGLVRIGDWAAAGDTREVWDGSEWVRANATLSGYKPTVELKLSTNRSLFMTSDHKVSSDGNFVEAGEMVDKVLDVSRPNHVLGEKIPRMVIAGMLHGDGTTHAASGGKWYLNVGDKDSEMREYMLKHDDFSELRVYSGREQVWTTALYPVQPVPIPERDICSEVYLGGPNTVSSFLQGLYSANGSVVATHKRVNLKTTNKAMAEQVMDMLSMLGIRSSLVTTKATAVKHHNGTYVSKEAYAVVINGVLDVSRFAEQIGFLHGYKNERLAAVVSMGTVRPSKIKVLAVVPTGIVEPVYDFHMEKTHYACVSGYKVHNCGEYLSISDSSCNLGSLNLMKFYDPESRIFDYHAFSSAIRIAITAMDISCSFGDFPLPKIEENTRRYRQLGLGYANLGALLIAMGHPYDSDEGRRRAADITELMTYTAYSVSHQLAQCYGPYSGFQDSKQGLLKVLERHAGYASAVDAELDWLHLIEDIEKDGVRNCQVTLLAPTGTIGLAMGCSTTGIEPAFGLTSYKKTVTGDTITMTIPEVEMGMRILGMREFDPTHPVFATANGSNAIEPMGHVRMMSAVQPFLSCSISKTVNLPETATVEDIEQVYIEGWKRGLKSIAVYRDGSKTSQPMSVKSDANDTEAVETYFGDTSTRRKLPKKRRGYTHSFSVAGTEGYLTTGEHEDGSLGEIFLTVSKAGSTLNGLLDAVAVLTSIGLQYGVPLETLVDKFSGTKYAPAGLTDDRDVRMSSSLLDYIFRRLELDYLSDDFDVEGSEEVAGIAPDGAVPQTGITTGEICSICGGTLQRAGSCHVCTSCGSTTGCS